LGELIYPNGSFVGITKYEQFCCDSMNCFIRLSTPQSSDMNTTGIMDVWYRTLNYSLTVPRSMVVALPLTCF